MHVLLGPQSSVTQTAPNIKESKILQVLRCSTGHTRDINSVHCHRETRTLPLKEHMQMISLQCREGGRNPDHLLHQELHEPPPDRLMKMSPLFPEYAVLMHGCEPSGNIEKERVKFKKRLHTAFVEQQLESEEPHRLLQARAPEPPDVSPTEQQLHRPMRITLAKLRAMKGPLLRSWQFDIGAAEDPSCPLCGLGAHTTESLFSCPTIDTTLPPEDQWQRPVQTSGWRRRKRHGNRMKSKQTISHVRLCYCLGIPCVLLTNCVTNSTFQQRRKHVNQKSECNFELSLNFLVENNDDMNI